MKNILAFILLLFTSDHIEAITLTPSILEFNIDDSQSASIIVTNTSTGKLALEANIYKLNFLANGQLKDKQLSNESLMVFPIAALLKPGEKQLFRLQWMNNRALEQSESYFVRFSQINLSSPKQTNDTLRPNIMFQLHYNAVVHTYSSRHQPRINMTISPHGAIVLENKGNRYSYTSSLRFEQAHGLGGLTWNELLGEHFIPPKSKIELSIPHQLPSGDYYGHIR